LNKRSGKIIGVWMLSLFLIFSSVGVVSAASATDLKGHWAEETIKTWVDKGLAYGYEDNTFRPDGKVNRQEFTALVNRAFKFGTPGTVQFTDVFQTDWSYSEIAVGVNAGYVSGYPDGTFKPRNELSRQEVAVVMAKVLGLKTSSSVDSYADVVSIPEWSKGAISAVKDYEVMGGYPDGAFHPQQTTTRAEAIVILDRAVKLKAELDNTVPTPEPTEPTTPVTGLPPQPTLLTAKVEAGAIVNINAPSDGVTAWLAPAGTTEFIAGANMTSLVGNSTASTIVAPTTPGGYKLYIVNVMGASLPSIGTLTVE
jgi:hypothetical protein